MRKLFKGFYTPNTSEARDIWDDACTIFVFDTNFLLNFYSYEEETRNELFDLLNVIKDRLWLPHQVALEYQMRRLEIIARERDTFHKIDRFFERINEDISVKIIDDLKIKSRLPVLAKELDSFSKKINSLIIKFRNEVLERQQELKPDVISHDSIREKFDSLFQSNIGNPYSNEELLNIYSEGLARYQNKIPPGFKDRPKDELEEYIYSGCSYKKEFGDLIIWKQILNMAKKPQVKNVVFITDEKKEDWWYQIRKKMVGPLQALQTEIYNETAIEHFKMYDTSSFLQAAKEYVNADIKESSLEDISSVIKVNREEIIYDYRVNELKNSMNRSGVSEAETILSNFFNLYKSELNTAKNEKETIDLDILKQVNAVKEVGVLDSIGDVGGTVIGEKNIGVVDEKNDLPSDVSRDDEQ